MAVINITDENFNQEIQGNDKVVVKYFAGWCGSCRLLAPKFKRFSEEEGYAGIRFIEVDAENNPEARKMAGVTNLPFVATFEKGTFKEGYATNKEEAIRSMIQNLN